MLLKEIGNRKFLGKGTMSRCYLLEDGKVLKLFKRTRNLYEMDNFKYFLEYSNDSFVFPFEFIYDSRKFYGYIMKKAPGKALKQIFSKSTLTNLSNHSYKLERDIDFVSSGGIFLYDLHDENVLYDGNKYSVIDPDENAISDNPLRAKEFNNKAHRMLIGNLFLDNIESIKHTRLIRKNIYEYKNIGIRPSEMIAQVKSDMENYYKEKIETLEDINNIIRR